MSLRVERDAAGPAFEAMLICPPLVMPILCAVGNDRDTLRAGRAALVLVAVLVYAIALTHGSLDLTVPELKNRTFVSMWEHFTRGQFDVDPSAIGDEAYTIDGKTYTYFGPFPALVRGVFKMFIQRDWDFARPSLLLAAGIFIFCLCKIIDYQVSKLTISVRDKHYLSMFMSIAWIFGTPFFFLNGSGFIYHEPVLWGMAWTFGFFYVCLRTLDEGLSLANGVLLAIYAGLTDLSRVSLGLGPSLLLAGLLLTTLFRASRNEVPSDKRVSLVKSAFLSGGIYCLFFAVLLGVNYGRWGNPIEFQPMQHYFQATGDPDRLRRDLLYGTFNLQRVPAALEYYFVPGSQHFKSEFPFIQQDSQLSALARDKDLFDYVEPFNIPLTVNSPFTVIVGGIGLLAFIRQPRTPMKWVLAAFGLQAAIILGYQGLILRYQVDMLPFFFTCGLLALPVFQKYLVNERARKPFLVTLGLVGVLSIYLTTMNMLLYKAHIWSVPDDVRNTLQGILD